MKRRRGYYQTRSGNTGLRVNASPFLLWLQQLLKWHCFFFSCFVLIFLILFFFSSYFGWNLLRVFSFLTAITSVSLPESLGLGVADFSHSLLPTGVSSGFCSLTQRSVLYKFQATFLASEDNFQIIHVFSLSSTSLPFHFLLALPIFSSPNCMASVLCLVATFKFFLHFPFLPTFALFLCCCSLLWDSYLESQLSLLFCQIECLSWESPFPPHLYNPLHLTFNMHFSWVIPPARMGQGYCFTPLVWPAPEWGAGATLTDLVHHPISVVFRAHWSVFGRLYLAPPSNFSKPPSPHL